MRNEKAVISTKDYGLNTNLTNRLTNKTNSQENRFVMNTIPQNKPQFQYKCSFCWRELPHNGLRFAGFGVCPPHLKLAETIVDALRRHRAQYFNSDLGVKR